MAQPAAAQGSWDCVELRKHNERRLLSNNFGTLGFSQLNEPGAGCLRAAGEVYHCNPCRGCSCLCGCIMLSRQQCDRKASLVRGEDWKSGTCRRSGVEGCCPSKYFRSQKISSSYPLGSLNHHPMFLNSTIHPQRWCLYITTSGNKAFFYITI